MMEAFNSPATYIVVAGIIIASFYIIPAISMGTSDCLGKNKK